MPTSSNAMTINRRQIAEPRDLNNVSAARCAISISLRRMDFCSKLLTIHGSATIGFHCGAA